MGLQIVEKSDSHPRKVFAAVYSRVSTVGHGQDPAMQTRELADYCQRRGWEIVRHLCGQRRVWEERFTARAESPNGGRARPPFRCRRLLAL